MKIRDVEFARLMGYPTDTFFKISKRQGKRMEKKSRRAIWAIKRVLKGEITVEESLGIKG